MVGGELIGFSEVKESIRDFEQVLQEHNITVESKSTLEALMLVALDWETRQRSQDTLVGSLEEQRDFRGGLGMYDLARRVIRARNHPDFSALLPHLNLLNKAHPAQTLRKRLDDSTNKLFELFIGLLAMEIGTNLRLDDPISSKGDNPDVTIFIDKLQVGFACKVLNGESEKTAWDRFTDGIAQLEKSTLNLGFIVFGLRNIIRYDDIWPIYQEGENFRYRQWSSWTIPLAKLLNTGVDLGNRLLDEYGTQNFNQRLTNPRVVPGILMFMQAATGADIIVGPTLTILNCLYLLDPIGKITSTQKAIVGQLETQLHFLEKKPGI